MGMRAVKDRYRWFLTAFFLCEGGIDVRLFLGLWLPGQWRERLAGLEVPCPGVKWVEKENLHLTLRFLGEVDEKSLPSLQKHLASISLSPFTLQSSGPGAFPDRLAPRVLWWGVRGRTERDSQRLFQLKTEVDEALSRWGMAPEARGWRPHITLARVKEGARVYWPPQQNILLPPWPVTGFALIASTLTAQGPIYRNLCEFSLSGQEEKKG